MEPFRGVGKARDQGGVCHCPPITSEKDKPRALVCPLSDYVVSARPDTCNEVSVRAITLISRLGLKLEALPSRDASWVAVGCRSGVLCVKHQFTHTQNVRYLNRYSDFFRVRITVWF